GLILSLALSLSPKPSSSVEVCTLNRRLNVQTSTHSTAWKRLECDGSGVRGVGEGNDGEY
ncbi:hypothetical protein FHU41_001609, partial [Psychromicrobium silvestre]|nr:hypothetical protein [Psychromicrobium silvestre]